ncbi:biotin synthase [Oceanococcus atlanticus]|uniref:Biotin synthase n=1 Tax=Oceanococcus atlanticus TaxID=1317117 RepID=A0A1Y1SAY9_9GAMM|nr:biotin synthase BioB [Oceanococcus atlanticus]ORE85569.1 biotin synthase [Oceanococcus atlanticus]RZO82605.1 MAG: biotin synthase BioB [Oceanococcus sp.]
MAELRHDWRADEVRALFDLPFNDLLFRAQSVHRAHFDPNEVQLSTLLNIKTGACPEDCSYCPQSVRYNTGLDAEPLMQVEQVREAAERAKQAGATRFCMGAAWRSPKDRDIVAVAKMIKAVRDLGMETCMTLGMLTEQQAQQLRDAGLDYYNHNVDTSPEYYEKIITTRTYQDRLDTLDSVRKAGMKVCCGGIVGLGEEVGDRAEMLRTLANLPTHPESVPINQLVKVEGTPLDQVDDVAAVDFVRTIAVARILMPKSMVRLSAGRTSMSPAVQALCFFAGANSMFYGEKLLTTGNPEHEADQRLMADLGIRAMAVEAATECQSQPAAADGDAAAA